jgi:PAS domain S-box-containing protein
MLNGTLHEKTLDCLLEGFQVIDFDWRYRYVNTAAVQQSRFSKTDLMGHTMMEKYPGVEKTDMFRTLERCMRDRTPATIESKFVYADGAEAWFELHIQPVPEGLFILSIDISERKKAELDLAYLNERLDDLVYLRTIELEEKNREIMDSLRYAQEIQQAFLSTGSEIKSLFPESFVIYQPKNVVSGDFYWCKKKENTILLAAGDCTGHGVPGALMSMLGIEKLSSASKKSDEPATILRKLNREIKTSLQSTANFAKSNDGMDIALCSISPDRKKLRFAGASRPLWLMKKGAPEIEQIKTSIRSIGGYTDFSQEFGAREVDLQEGDTFYIFSDGYPDTFGGPAAKKITTKKFRNLLAQMREKSMAEQRSELEQFLAEWKGGQELTDDIVVIGVRI